MRRAERRRLGPPEGPQLAFGGAEEEGQDDEREGRNHGAIDSAEEARCKATRTGTRSHIGDTNRPATPRGLRRSLRASRPAKRGRILASRQFILGNRSPDTPFPR